MVNREEIALFPAIEVECSPARAGLHRVRSGSKCEELGVSKVSPLYPSKRTSMKGVATSRTGQRRPFKARSSLCQSGSVQELQAKVPRIGGTTSSTSHLHHSLANIPEARPPVIGSKQKRCCENQGKAVIQIALEQMTRTAAEYDLLT